MIRNSYVEVDLAALRTNMAAVRRQVGADITVIAVVKANGYGHGAVEVSCALLREKAFVKERAVRLLGIAISHLSCHADRQLDLFAPKAQGRRHRLDHALDELRRRLGAEAVRRARLLVQPPRPGPHHPKDKG